MLPLFFLQLGIVLAQSGFKGIPIPRPRQAGELTQCRQNFTTDVWTLCEDVLAQFSLTLEQFTALNPQVGEICGAFVPGEAIADQDANITISQDGSCGPEAEVLSTCVGSEFGDCCGPDGMCGSGEEFCGIGNCQEGACLGDGPYSIDGRCGRHANYVPCPQRFGTCCSQAGRCGTGPSFCGAGCQYGNLHLDDDHVNHDASYPDEPPGLGEPRRDVRLRKTLPPPGIYVWKLLLRGRLLRLNGIPLLRATWMPNLDPTPPPSPAMPSLEAAKNPASAKDADSNRIESLSRSPHLLSAHHPHPSFYSPRCPTAISNSALHTCAAAACRQNSLPSFIMTSHSHSSPIGKLAPEVLVDILGLVYRAPGGRSDLAACLSVCRLWSQHGRTILYRHIFLDSGVMPCFLDAFDRNAAAAHTSSLTLRASNPSLADWELSQGDYLTISSKLLDGWLRRFADEVIPDMEGLTSLSVTPHLLDYCELSRSTLAAILQALPATCVDLELDANGRDRDGTEGTSSETLAISDSVHLCEHVRALLPRLHYARVNLRYTCDALVGESTKSGFRPIEMPMMEQLVVNCRRGWTTSGCCPQATTAAPSSWHSVLYGLNHVIDRGGLRPGAELLVLAQVGGSEHDRSNVMTLLRCHAMERATWAYPIAMPARPSIDGNDVYHIRTHRGGFVGERSTSLQGIAEHHSWVSLKDGSRLPRHQLSSALVDEAETGVETEEAWRARWPRLSCGLWANEKKTGMRLIEATKRTGGLGEEGGYDVLRGLVESTPDGWHRPVEKLGAFLERVEGSE
ncbi:hypothetical protein S40293_09444 [Stachybotrys chartarum IBT 40293]|nr:hypothetical protein S40293_09444 [Stachybotrys chartarum IBT 40293]